MQDPQTPFELATRIQESTGELPPMPAVAAQALELLSKDTATAVQLDQLISRDPSLATQVLRLANSSFYARGSAVKSVRQAVVNIGFNATRSAILAASMRGLYRSFGPREQLLWEHAFGCGLAARLIAQKVRQDSPDQAFLAGLLHDVGQTVLLLKVPDRMGPILDGVRDGRVEDSRGLESEAFGFDHADVGQLLARRWRFGPEIEHVIGGHHDPSDTESLCRTVNLADQICHRLGIGAAERPELALASQDLDPAALEELAGEIDGAYETNVVQLTRPA
jgi:HD-like signal output (HDOD) protein